MDYLPALHRLLVQPLVSGGTGAIPSVITALDAYQLDRDDWDSLVDLGIHMLSSADGANKIPAPVKAAFTKRWVV